LKILSIEKSGISRLNLWIEDAGQYKSIVLLADESIEEWASVPVSKYENYEHFVWVMGKFNPYTAFRIKPETRDKLDFEDLTVLANKFEKEVRDFAKEKKRRKENQ
jgi:hypothetical protein